jgi:hypothetical protein
MPIVEYLPWINSYQKIKYTPLEHLDRVDLLERITNPIQNYSPCSSLLSF